MGGKQSSAAKERKAVKFLIKGQQLFQKKKYAEAVASLTKSLEFQEEAKGHREDAGVAKILFQLAVVVNEWNEADGTSGVREAQEEELSLLEEAADIQRRVLGPDKQQELGSTMLRIGILKIGMLRSHTGGPDTAIEGFRALEAYATLSKMSDNDPVAPGVYHNMGALLLANKEDERGLDFLARSVAVASKLFPPDDPSLDKYKSFFELMTEVLAPNEATTATISAASPLGISLRYVDGFIKQHGLGEGDFNGVCAKVREITHGQVHGSFAEFLMQHEDTKQFVKPQADVFVSYAWKNNVGEVMKTLIATLPNEEEDVFIWMDVFVVDQHMASLGTMDFVKWTEVFSQTLSQIGKAYVLMLPALRPISATRSWCIYEWYVLASQNVTFANLVSQTDKDAFIERILKHGMTSYEFRDVTSGINISNATACKVGDQEAILSLVESIGTIKVNDVVMKALKDFMLSLLDSAIAAGKIPDETLNAMISKSELLYGLGQFEPGRTVTEEIDEYVRAHSDQVSPRMKALVIRNQANRMVRSSEESEEQKLAKVEEKAQMAQFLEAHKTDKREDLIAATAVFVKDLVDKEAKRVDDGDLELYNVAKEMFKDDEKELSTTLFDQGHMIWHNYSDRLDEALGYMKQALAIQERLHGGKRHPDVLRTMFEIASLHLFRCATIPNPNMAEVSARFEEVLQLQRIVLGPDHADVGMTLTNLGMIKVSDGSQLDLAGAESCFRQSLNIATRNLGREHHQCAGILFGLARALAAQGRFEEALSLAEESKANNERTYPGVDVSTINPILLPAINVIKMEIENKKWKDFVQRAEKQDQELAAMTAALGQVVAKLKKN